MVIRIGGRKTNTNSIYGGRHDISSMLRSSLFPGREYLLLVSDDWFLGLKYNNAPNHIIGLLTSKGKLGTYSHWKRKSVKIEEKTVEFEYYNYETPEGLLKCDNVVNKMNLKNLTQILFQDIVSNEL